MLCFASLNSCALDGTGDGEDDGRSDEELAEEAEREAAEAAGFDYLKTSFNLEYKDQCWSHAFPCGSSFSGSCLLNLDVTTDRTVSGGLARVVIDETDYPQSVNGSLNLQAEKNSWVSAAQFKVWICSIWDGAPNTPDPVDGSTFNLTVKATWY